MKYSFTLLLTAFLAVANAQYSTPGNSGPLTLADLVALSDGAVTNEDGSFQISEELLVVAGDTLLITTSDSIFVGIDVLITIEGGFVIDAEVVITSCCSSFFGGIRFEEGSHGSLNGATIDHGGGIRVLTEDFQMVGCTLQYQSTAASSGGALGLSSGKPLISNCVFIENQSAAIGSSANIAVAPVIEFCTFTGNNTENSNRPQINMGPSGSDTTFIRNNVVEGYSGHTMAGGIAFSSLTGVEGHVVISDNSVSNNRYGIAVIGSNIYSRVDDNLIVSNNTQGDPLLGGSGINFFGAGETSHIATGNVIRENLWGITIQGVAFVNLGEIDNFEIGPGSNSFDDNGNEGEIYALFNNTPNEVFAQGNCWDEDEENPTLETAEAVISHYFDDPELGEVIFDPLGVCAEPLGLIDDAGDRGFMLYPNPARDFTSIQSAALITKLVIYDLTGRQVSAHSVAYRKNMELNLSDLNSGVYLIQIQTVERQISTKLIVD